MTATAPTTVLILGKRHPVRPPASFAEREELVMAWTQAGDQLAPLRRVFAAAVALCTRALAPKPGEKRRLPVYTGDVLSFGAAAYDAYVAASDGASLSERVSELYEAGQAIMVVVADTLAPREDEVKERAGFSNPAAESSTPPASGSA